MSNAVFHDYFQSPLGWIALSASANKVHAVQFLDTSAIPQLGQQQEAAPPVLALARKQLEAYFAGQLQVFDFPFEQEGTAFQQRIWQLLQDIPYGKTISYLELSKRLGDTKAIRAAAAANGRNNLAIVVPCHRVIGSQQNLVGYAGGLWRKRWLLDLENKVANGVRELFS